MTETMIGFLMTALSLLLLAELSHAGVKSDYCQWEKFNATCPSGQVILMESAKYGRMNIGRCLPADYFMGCTGDVLVQIDQRCSGRRSCSIDIPDSQLDIGQPCRKDLVVYLEASYDCVKVVNPWLQHKVFCSKTIDITNMTEGFIASYVTADTTLGARRCPWQINALPGQRINVTLLDFSVYEEDPSSSSATDPLQPSDKFSSLSSSSSMKLSDTRRQSCNVYAKLEEGDSIRGNHGMWTNVEFCEHTEKRRWLLETKGHTLRIQINVTKQLASKVNFMFHFEVIGCADIKPVEHGHIERKGDSLMISCNHTTKETWHLVCKGTQWIGAYHNCTSAYIGQPPPGSEEQGFPLGLLIAIAIGVIVGVVLGFVFLIVIFVCRRRTRHDTKLDSGNPLMGPGQIDSDQQNIYRLVEVRPPPMMCDCQYTPGTDHKSMGSIDNTLLMQQPPGECLYRTNPRVDPGECHYQSREGDTYQPQNMSPLKTCDIISDIHVPDSLPCCEGPDWYTTAHQQYLRSQGEKVPRIPQFPGFNRDGRNTASRNLPSSRDSGNVTDTSDASTAPSTNNTTTFQSPSST